MILFKIVWTIALIGPNGANYKDIPEPYAFRSKDQCNEFGTKMFSRMEDWTRGALNLAWEMPVTLVWRCEPAGRPA